ncbi:glycosyltransferase [Aminipila luticellarii]|uniref:Glycosyltransferase subfamily 4-like N-terminal domain-containing protein n=1 Tax=Aminipila luticellarii TaxID=2507160 RepID=A0A410PSN5_9FIRM|nr:glycosyltransferase [Aminipila luticellarii]QAT41896.1 hypothetical protein EQM06_00905 [Aminipila luticellarii]
MKKIIFITTRNIINTSGELRLIKNRGQALFNTFGVETYYFSLSPIKRKDRPKESLGDGSKLHAFYFKSYWGLKKQTKRVIREITKEISDEDIIIISGYMPRYLIQNIKKLRVKTILDIHGTLEELKEYVSDTCFSKLKNYIRYTIFSNSEKEILVFAKGVLVVSKALKERYAAKYSIDSNLIYVIPCGGNKEKIDLEEVQKHRLFWREELNIADEEILFIYSGGISPWQSIDEMIQLYIEIKGNICRKCKLLIMSGDIHTIKKYESREQDIIIRSFTAEQVQHILCAGDIAMLLRNNTVTNNLAFPNKFYEYLLSGMYIICSKFIYDQAALTDKYGVGFTTNGKLDSDIITAIENMEPIESRKGNIDLLLQELSFKNTLQTFVKKQMGWNDEKSIFNSGR